MLKIISQQQVQTSNRTKVELKLPSRFLFAANGDASNRTKVELKYKVNYYKLYFAILLIVPKWN